MNKSFFKVKSFLLDLDFCILHENEVEGIMVVEKESTGISNLVIGIADPLLIMEQFIMELHEPSFEIYQSLLKKNRDIIHGAFVIDESGKKIIFRETLQLESLDLNEVDASLDSLSLLLNEYSDELIKFSKSQKSPHKATV